MHPCPTCSARTITARQKCNAASTLPARCGQCGGLCDVKDSIHVVATLAAEVCIWGSIVLALVARAWWPLLLIPIAWAGWVVGVGRFATLMPINEPAVAANRRISWRLLLIFAMLMAVGYALLGEH